MRTKGESSERRWIMTRNRKAGERVAEGGSLRVGRRSKVGGARGSFQSTEASCASFVILANVSFSGLSATERLGPFS